jgi:dethiobiotin synthetase
LWYLARTRASATVFSAALADAMHASYWKPVQSGLEDVADSDTVARLGGLPAHRILPEAYRLSTPASPHLSARLDGVTIDAEKLEPPACNGPLIIEGAGGVLVPLSEKILFADVFARWGIPVILCARTSLGTINHALLSVEALRNRKIPICGVAFIGSENPDTQAIIGAIGKVKVLGRLPLLESLSNDTLHRAFLEAFELASFTESRV